MSQLGESLLTYENGSLNHIDSEGFCGTASGVRWNMVGLITCTWYTVGVGGGSRRSGYIYYDFFWTG